MGHKIVEVDSLWIVPPEIVSPEIYGDSEDPLFGLDIDYRDRLEKEFSRYCFSIKSREGLCVCGGHDIDDFVIDDSYLYEGKSLSSLRARGKKMLPNTRYKNLVKKEQGLASSQFKKQVDKFAKAISEELSSYFKQNSSLAAFRTTSARLFEEIYTAAWAAGKRASGAYKVGAAKPTSSEERWFRDSVREELSYWNSFLDELPKSDFTQKRFSVDERLQMYIDTVWHMYQSARVAGLPDAVLLFWYPTKKKSGGRMCPGCEYMVKMSPFTRNTMPTVPRGGDTPCLWRCVHKIVVRYASPARVEKRKSELPTKAKMANDLLRFMGKKVKKQRKKTKDYNPWSGRRLGELK